MLRKLILSCNTATALMEKKLREKLSFTQRIQLSLHKAVCVFCRRYEKQSALLERLFKTNNKSPVTPDLDAQVEALEGKIQQRLDRKYGE